MSDSKETKEVTFLPALTSMLKPSAEYIGEELKNTLKSKVEEHKKKKEQDNLVHHLNSVKTKSAESEIKSNSYAQLDMFDDWVDNVSKIDPNQTELAKIWQNLLVKAGEGDFSEVLLSKLKSLSSGEAMALMKFSKPANTPLNKEDRYHLMNLEKKELIEPNEAFLSLIQVMFGLTTIFVIFTMLKLSVFDGLFSSLFTENKFEISKAFIYLLPLGIYAGAFLITVQRLKKTGRWAKKIKRLTWIGQRLVNLGSE